MKESQLYLKFIARNLWLFVVPIIISWSIAIYFYSQQPMKTKVIQEFKINYEPNNIEMALPLTDQAIAELRAQRFETFFAGSVISIFKSGPLMVNFEVTALTKEQSFELLLKEIAYLKQNFSVSELTNPQIVLIEPDLLEYLISGLLIGFLFGLISALTVEYFKTY